MFCLCLTRDLPGKCLGYLQTIVLFHIKIDATVKMLKLFLILSNPVNSQDPPFPLRVITKWMLPQIQFHFNRIEFSHKKEGKMQFHHLLKKTTDEQRVVAIFFHKAARNNHKKGQCISRRLRPRSREDRGLLDARKGKKLKPIWCTFFTSKTHVNSIAIF